MDNKDISKQILAQIKEKKIQPRPKWHFAVKNTISAGLVAVLLSFASIAFSIMLFLLINNDWDLRHRVAPGIMLYLFSTFPYIWAILFILFISLFYLIFRKIKGGYRFKYSLIIILGAVFVMAIGSIIYQMGLAKTLDLAFRRGVPQYQRAIEKRNNIWLQPQRGILIGKLVRIESKDKIIIMDPQEQEWTVDISRISEQEKKIIREGWPIKVIGEIVKNEDFCAQSIRIAPRGYYYKKMKIQSPAGEMQIIERNIMQMRII